MSNQVQQLTSTQDKAGQNHASLVLQLTAIGWLVAKLISWKLWTGERLFPLVPVGDIFTWPAPVHTGLYIISLVMLVAILLLPQQRVVLAVLMLSEILACAADQNRWQPWQYQYLFTAGIFLFANNNSRFIYTAIGFIMACTYLYSGISKLNEGYLAIVWDNMLLKRFFHVGAAMIGKPWLHYIGYVAPAVELIAGIGLCWYSTRKRAAWLLFIMHLLLLIFLGPFGLKYNIVVWPWNLLMMTLLYLIFIRNEAGSFTLLWKGWGKILLVCWGILPCLNLAGWWDHYLSCSLYSGKTPHLSLCIRDSIEMKALLPYKSKQDVYKLCDGTLLVNAQTWAMKELKVPPYPELRVYEKIREIWKEKHPNSTTEFIYFQVVSKDSINRLVPKEIP